MRSARPHVRVFIARVKRNTGGSYWLCRDNLGRSISYSALRYTSEDVIQEWERHFGPSVATIRRGVCDTLAEAGNWVRAQLVAVTLAVFVLMLFAGQSTGSEGVISIEGRIRAYDAKTKTIEIVTKGGVLYKCQVTKQSTGFWGGQNNKKWSDLPLDVPIFVGCQYPSLLVLRVWEPLEFYEQRRKQD